MHLTDFQEAMKGGYTSEKKYLLNANTSFDMFYDSYIMQPREIQ